MTDVNHPKTSRQASAVRRTLRIGLLLFAAYLLAGNVFLNTPLANLAFNRAPDRFHLHWKAAVTPLPGVVYAWGVVTGGHARHIEWTASAEAASGRIALWPLLSRELRLPSISADQVTFAAQRVERFIAPREPSARAWTIALPTIQTDTLLEARWSEWRLLGFGSASFGMIKQLRSGPLEILPSTLSMRDGRLTRNEVVLMSEATIDAELSIDRHTAADYPGKRKLAITHVALAVDAAVDSLDITLDAGKPLDLALRKGEGRVSANLALERGELLTGGRALIRLPLSMAIDGGERRENVLTLQANVDDEIEIDAQLPEQPDGGARLDTQLKIAQRHLPFDDMAALLPDTSGRIALRWRFDSLSWLSELLVKKPWFTFDGAGELDADLSIESGKLVAGSRFALPAVEVQADVLNDRISGSGQAIGVIDIGDDGEPQARVDVALDEFRIAPEESATKAYVQGKQLSVELRSSGDLAEFRKTVVARGRFSNAEVPDLTLFNTYLPKREMRFTQGRGTLSGDLTIDAEGEVSNGTLDVRAKGAGMHLARVDVTGDLAVNARLSRGDLKHKDLQLDGTEISFSSIAFKDASGNAQRDWWARVTLPRARTVWGRPMAIDAEAKVVVKNVGFLLAMFSQKKKFPRWVTRVVDAGEAQARAQMQIRSSSLVLDQLVAENDRFTVQSRLKVADAKATGDLLLSWGVLSMGVELDETDRDFRLIGARSWFESRPNLLNGPAAH